HVRPAARDHVPVTGSPNGEHARAGCRAQETSRRPTIAGRVDKARSRYNKGTIRNDLRYLVVSKDVRRHRLISISYITTLPCHGRGREFESRRPRHFLSEHDWRSRCRSAAFSPRIVSFA